MLKLRLPQEKGLKASKEKYEAGIYRQLLVLPTGVGKTICFACLLEHHCILGRMLVLVHREELAQQAADKIRKWNSTYTIGIEMGDLRSDPRDRVVVGSVQSLSRAGLARFESISPDSFAVVVVDEAHHATADSYKVLLDRLGFFDEVPPKRLLLGVTATPGRGDGQGLAQVFEEIVYSYSMLDAIRDGWLVMPRGFRIRTDIKLDDVHTVAGDFNQNELSNAVNTPYRNGVIVREWKLRAANRRTICFAVDIQHAQDLAEMFRKQAIKAEAVWGNDPERRDSWICTACNRRTYDCPKYKTCGRRVKENPAPDDLVVDVVCTGGMKFVKGKINRHKDGEIAVLCNCGILTEGYDDPGVDCIVLARPTKSQLLFIQMAGRGARLEEGVSNFNDAVAAGYPITKPDFLVLDVTDTSSKHSLISIASIFGLPPKLDLKGKTILEAVEEVENVELAKPGIDLSACEDLDKLQSHAEEIDLFTVKFPPEVMEHSELQWMLTPKGNYILSLPGKEYVTVSKDILGHWVIEGLVNGSFFRDKMRDLGDAFAFADTMLKTLGRKLMTLMKRSVKSKTWRDDRADVKQLEAIKFLLSRRGREIPDLSKLTKGAAQKLLNKIGAEVTV